MPKGKVLKTKELKPYEYGGKTINKVLVVFEKGEDGKHFTGAHHYEKETPFSAGIEVEYDIVPDKYESYENEKYPRISPTKQKQGGGFGGGGGQKRYPKTYNEYLNELAWQTQQHTINFFCHRTTLDPLTKFQEYYDVFYKSAFEKLKKEQ